MRARKTSCVLGDGVKILLTMEEAAQALSLGLSSMYQLVLSQQVYSIKVGRSRRVPLVSLQEFVERQMRNQ
jgi:excisionase family DNA binding protein